MQGRSIIQQCRSIEDSSVLEVLLFESEFAATLFSCAHLSGDGLWINSLATAPPLADMVGAKVLLFSTPLVCCLLSTYKLVGRKDCCFYVEVSCLFEI